MTAYLVTPPFDTFFDESGQPVDAGYIYLGVAGKNPEITANQINVYWDKALTIPAAQPIRTVSGYPARDGTPARVYVNAFDYSITVRDRQRGLVYTALTATSNTPADAVFPVQEPTRYGSEVVGGILTLNVAAGVAGVNSLDVVIRGSTQTFGVDYLIPADDQVQFLFDVAADDEINIQGLRSIEIGVTDASLVTYTPSGSGAPPTDMQSKIRTIVTSATNAQFNDQTSDINKYDKYPGKAAWSSTDGIPVYSSGGAVADVWKKYSDNTTAYTPV